MGARGLASVFLVLLLNISGPVESTLSLPPPTWEKVFAEAEVAFVGVVVANEPRVVYRVLERFVGQPEDEFAFSWRSRSHRLGQVDLIFAKRRISREGEEYWGGLGSPNGSHLPLSRWEESDAVARTRSWAAEHPLRFSSTSQWEGYSLPVFEFSDADQILHYTARCAGERTVEYELYGSGRVATMNAVAENIWPPGDLEYGVSSGVRDLLLRRMALSGLFDQAGREGLVPVQLTQIETKEDVPECEVRLKVSLQSYTDSGGARRSIQQTLLFENPMRPQDYTEAAERRLVEALGAITQIVKTKKPWWRREKLWLLGTVRESPDP